MTLNDSLRKFVEPHVLEGDNQWEVERDGKPVKACLLSVVLLVSSVLIFMSSALMT